MNPTSSADTAADTAAPPRRSGPMAAGVDVGVSLPQVFPDGVPEPGAISGYAAAAERFGFDSLWVQSQLIGRVAVLDPITELAFAAAATSSIGLGASVLIATEYHPVQLAKQLATLDQLSAGRLIVRLGLGSPNSTYEIEGMPRDRQVRRLIETVELMRALWTDSEVTYEGQIYRLGGLPMEPKPRQRPGLPLWLGGRGEQALRRAARHGSGWMGPGASTMAMFRDQVTRLRAGLVEAGRADDPFTIAKRLYVTVDDREEVARQRMRARLQHYGHPDQRAEEVAAYGTPEQVAEQLAAITTELAAVEGPGARLLMLSPIHDFADQLTGLADIVKPSARRPVDPAATDEPTAQSAG
jgi:probable F420-dependent oxidoreductase